MRIRIALLLLLACFLTGSCVQEVDFSEAFEKKVVVHCVIHSVVKYQGRPFSGSVYHQSGPCLQHLFMYFNSQDGSKERLQSATARLYDNETGMLLGEFSRVSDWEWQMVYEPAYGQIEEGVKKYDLNLRLEITDIPGVENPITGVTSFNRMIDGGSVKWLRRHLFGVDIEDYTQYATIAAPAWFLPESITETVGEHFVPINCHAIKTTYAYADPCSYSNGCYQYGVRILPFNYQDIFDLAIENMKPLDPGSLWGNRVYFYLSYVSEDYDRYLRDAIIYRIRHDNENDPLKHLYEDQVFSNIEGGVGIFGAEAVVYYTRWEDVFGV